MKIRLNKLRYIIREVLEEAGERQTVPAHLDPKEKETAAAFPTWGNTRSDTMKQKSPAEVKAKQIAGLLVKAGVVDDRDAKQKATQGLVPWLEKLDPSEMFMASPDDLAKKFATDVLGSN